MAGYAGLKNIQAVSLVLGVHKESLEAVLQACKACNIDVSDTPLKEQLTHYGINTPDDNIDDTIKSVTNAIFSPDDIQRLNAGNSRYIPPKAIEKDEIKHYLELIRDNGSVCPGAAAGVAKLRIKICLNDSARISESERAELNALKNNIRRSVPHSDLKDGGQRYETASAFTIALAPFLRAYHQQGVELSLRDENSSIGKILRAVGIDTTLALGEIADAVDKTFLRRDQFHKAMKDAGITLPGKGR